MRPPIVVLLGLPGAGKSSAGRIAAERLGYRFVDLDRLIEERSGMSVAELFASEGEAGFRAREGEATRAVLEKLEPADAGLILAPGGGWIEESSNLLALGATATTVHLRVSEAVALERLARTRELRPLLAGPDRASRLTELRRRREPLYLQSNHTVTVDSMSEDEVVASIVALASRTIAD